MHPRSTQTVASSAARPKQLRDHADPACDLPGGPLGSIGSESPQGHVTQPCPAWLDSVFSVPPTRPYLYVGNPSDERDFQWTVSRPISRIGFRSPARISATSPCPPDCLTPEWDWPLPL